jgi:hypothetical protein
LNWSNWCVEAETEKFSEIPSDEEGSKIQDYCDESVKY